jgi:uncharacterized protein (TIGR02145 family)
MKKIALLPVLILVTTTLCAQDYLISFAGTGASVSVDSVNVENLTQGTALTVGPGNQLQLLGSTTAVEPDVFRSGKHLQIFPNPSGGEATLSFEATSNAPAVIEVLDLSGRHLASTKTYLFAGRQSFRLCGLGGGSYVVQVRSEAYNANGKIICLSASRNSVEIHRMGTPSGNVDPGSLKTTQTIITMQYNTGDLLKFTGRSGKYGTVCMDSPAGSKTIASNFVSCVDADSNHYVVVPIGTQVWMAENLRTTTYGNGDPIPEVLGANQWAGLTTGAYCFFGGDPANQVTFGCLYNWYAVHDSRKVCPAGWHAPGDSEWRTLSTYLGGADIAGGKMKETGVIHWLSPNTGATNESGLTVIAGGYRHYAGNYDAFGYGGSFWTTTQEGLVYAKNVDIFYYNTVTNHHATDKKNGLSVRCVKN